MKYINNNIINMPYIKNKYMTYLIADNEGLIHDRLRELLNNAGFKERTKEEILNTNKYVDFFWMGQSKQSLDKDLYLIKSRLKTLLYYKKSHLTFTNKQLLYFNMLKYFPVICKKYMAKTRLLKDVKNVKKGEILIIKNDSGVTVVTNNKELEDAKEINKKFNNIIVSEYIKNPLLFENKKCHIRMYILINSDFTWSFWKKGKVMTAAFDYIQDDWTNKKIHYSHGLTTFKDIYFPEDILPENKIENILSQIKIILTSVAFIIEKHIKCYKESKMCCKVFGIDFMITDDYIIKLIEINAEPDYGSENNDLTIYKQYCKEYFDWFYSNSLVPLLFNNNNIRYIKPDINFIKYTNQSFNSILINNNTIRLTNNNTRQLTNINTRIINTSQITNNNTSQITNINTRQITNNNTRQITNNKKQLTYILIDKEQEIEEEFNKLLASKGFIKKDINEFPEYVDLLFTRNSKFFYNTLIDKKNYYKIFKIKSKLSSFLWRNKSTYKDGKDVIINKFELYKNMNKLFPDIAKKHMAETIDIFDLKNIKDSVYIIRPVGQEVGSGEGIEIIRNNKELEEVQNKYMLQNFYKNIIASKYIINPLLYGKKKFHIRVHMLFLYNNQELSYSINLNGRIWYARKEYINHNYNNLEIHDTHARYTARNIYFPEEFNYGKENTDKVLSQMNLILSKVVEIYKPYIKCFEGAENCFEVFGIDFMVEDDFNVILIEINDTYGLPPLPYNNNEESDNSSFMRKVKWISFIRGYVKWIYDNAISKIFNL